MTEEKIEEHAEEPVQRFIVIDGEEIPVTEEIYLAFKRPLWAERKRKDRESRCIDENGNRCNKDCRECDKERDGSALSLEKCVEDNHELVDSFDLAELIEEKMLKEQLHAAILEMPEEEQHFISIAFSGKPAQEIALELGLPRTTFIDRRTAIVKKLRKILK